jgi:DNA-binding beta-propeller fold protein YncE
MKYLLLTKIFTLFLAFQGTLLFAATPVSPCDASNLIRKIKPSGLVTTLAGTGQLSSVNGTGTDASFNRPRGITVDKSGNLFVADSYNHLIRKITFLKP